jgi:hypothetical protein
MNCSACLKTVTNKYKYEKCCEPECKKEYLFCAYCLFYIKRCDDCKLWRLFFCDLHKKLCPDCNEYEDLRRHIVKHKISCSVCENSIEFYSCCSHRTKDIIATRRKSYRRCHVCHWILCASDRMECKSCDKSYCLDHHNKLPYCKYCIDKIDKLTSLLFNGVRVSIMDKFNFNLSNLPILSLILIKDYL